MSTLFSSLALGNFTLTNRILMAPLTRSRAEERGVPSPLATDYYRQRAAAGPIITEGTQPSEGGKGYARTPGTHAPEQIEAWRKITDAVHAEGGKMFLQIMHAGRIAHPANRNIPDAPVAPSAVKPETTKMWTAAAGMQEIPTPRVLETGEIRGIIEEYRIATKNALAAGFYGVERHAASGCLPMQFLSTGTNLRTDQYGGPTGNRIRFVVETLQAMIEAADCSLRAGIKISPEMKFNDIAAAEPEVTYTTPAEALDGLNLAYLYVMRTGSATDYLLLMRPLFHGPLLAGGGFDFSKGTELLAAGGADAIVYGTPFISNPDLVNRFRTGAPLAPADPATFYTPGPKGYTDYPSL